MSCKGPKNRAMRFSWENINSYGIFIAFRDSVRSTPFREFLGIPMPESLGLCAGEKKFLWRLWFDSPCLLRPKDSESPGPFLRWPAHFSGNGNPPSFLSPVRKSETGAAGLVGRSAFLHQTLCPLRGAAVSGFEPPGYCPGAAPGLEDGQGPGDAVYAGATAQGGIAGAEGDWR